MTKLGFLTFMTLASAMASADEPIVIGASVYLDPPRGAPPAVYSSGPSGKDAESVMHAPQVRVIYEQVLLIDELFDAVCESKRSTMTKISPDDVEPLTVVVFRLESGNDVYWADRNSICNTTGCWTQSKPYRKIARSWNSLFQHL